MILVNAVIIRKFAGQSIRNKNMEKKRGRRVVMILFFAWTLLILYGSLAPSDDLPPMGWLAWIPYFDKVVHFGFYAGQVTLLLLWLQPTTRGDRFWVALCVITFSGTIELLQDEYFYRSKDALDLLANSVGALTGIPIAYLIRTFILKRFF